MSSEAKNVDTILPYGNNLRTLVASSKILTNGDVKSTLAQKGIFLSSQNKEETIPLILTSLLSPREYEDIKEKQKNKEAVPKRRSRSYNYIGTNDLVNVAKSLNDIEFMSLSESDFNNYSIVNVNTFQRFENNSNQLRMSYTIERTDLTKDWFEQKSLHEATMELSLNSKKDNVIISMEHSADETKEVNNSLLREVTSILKENDVIDDTKGKEIMFGDFSNKKRINFLLNFVNDSLDKSETFSFTEITNIEISIDEDKKLPEELKWMEDKVSNMKFEGKSLHETDLLKDNSNHSSLIISLLKINYDFKSKSNKGKCVIEIEFPTTRGNSVPNNASEFTFKIISIKFDKKINGSSAKRLLYRKFDDFKDECYQNTMNQKPIK